MGHRLSSVKREHRNQAFVSDDVARTDQVVRETCRKDDSLLWYLRTQAALRTRDAELPTMLKRKGEAWLRQNRPDMREKDKHLELASAISNAMLDNKVDRDYRTMLRRQDVSQVAAFNHFVGGKRLSTPGLLVRLLRAVGARAWANRVWLRSAEAVFPAPI